MAGDSADFINSLPVNEIHREFRENLRRAGCVVVTAPTGSGKSTQLPKWLLDEVAAGERVIVLQPRRLAARMLAERVAWELGETPGRTVGYITRLERSVSAATRLLFVTEGVLGRMLMDEKPLAGVGAVVFDEFHERTLNADLGLAMVSCLRRRLRPELKIVVMSATMDAGAAARYLDGCPVLAAGGRLYPVEVSYTARNDFTVYRNAALALRELLESGAAGDVLIFMPGAGEIRRCMAEIDMVRYPEKLAVLPLYGEMSPAAQRAVFAPSPCRKVIVATNIAETSLTIPGVRIVIDSGLVKLGRCDAVRGVDVLELCRCSRDAAEQRAGRAGREGPGICRRLWSAVEQDHRLLHTPPEVARMDLAEPVLSIHGYGFRDEREFPWFETPPEKAVAASRQLLERLGLISGAGEITGLGREALRFPAHPRIALMLCLGSADGGYELACAAAALLSSRPLLCSGAKRSLRTEQRGTNRRQSQQSGGVESDIIAQLQLLEAAREAHFEPGRCEMLGVNAAAAREMERNREYYLRLRPAGERNANAAPDQTRFARLLLRCFPDRLARRLDRGTLNCLMNQRRRAVLSEQSLVRDEDLIVAAEVREVALKNRPGTVPELGMASGVKEEWLWEDFADELCEEEELYWDSARQQVMQRSTLSCLGVVLEEKLRSDVVTGAASALLQQQLSSNSMPLLGWDEDCERYMARVDFVRENFPELSMPVFDEAWREQVIRAVCEGKNRYAAVRNVPVQPYVEASLTPAQRAAVQRLAPESLPLPRGRKLRISYQAGAAPKGRARIQELYDVHGPLRVGGGKIPVLLDILAPNYRTVQITDDLARFWEVHYPAIRSQLARRYPRHEWR